MNIRKSMCLMLALSMLIVSGTMVKAYTGHEPIRINSNNDFDANHGVSYGDGTENNPWIIENFEIDGSGEGYCIYIGNTTDYFIIQNCYLHNASEQLYHTYYEDSGLIFYNVENGAVRDSKMATNYNGIYLYESCNNVIENNVVIMNSYQGINLWHSSDYNRIINNSVGYNEWYGIYIVGYENQYSNIICDHNNISLNAAWYNVCGGMYLAIAEYNNIYCNDFSNNRIYGFGYSQDLANWNNITYNFISENDYGMYIGSSSENNYIYNNQVQSSLEYGIYITQSQNNLIHRNNIINNTYQAYDDSGNDWNEGYPSGGNYWGNYNGTDEYSGPYQNESGSDGIGDTPYYGIEGNGEDAYPLMGPAGTFGIGRRDDPTGIGRRDDPT